MAKIPFDIKYRPQIESGEYKVETREGYPVTIYRWDFDDGARTPIMGSYVFEDSKEYVGAWNEEGHFDLMSPNDLDLFIVTPEEEQEFSEFEIKMKEIRALYIAMQEQGVDDRYGDALSANLPGMIKWLTDKIELSKRERELSKAVHTGLEELTPFENGVLKMIDCIIKCITYPNDSCIPNVRTIAAELLSLARKDLIEERLTSNPRKTDLYKLGKAEALKDLPRWTIYPHNAGDEPIVNGILQKDGSYAWRLYLDGHKIEISDLTKLPGLKEDESHE